MKDENELFPERRAEVSARVSIDDELDVSGY
jgi:hypothetical protein